MAHDATALHSTEAVQRQAPRAHSIDDTAAILNISVSHAWALVKQGRLKVIKLGRRTLCTDAEIARLLATGC